jgi:murein DD-endopeptidase MepM/ murein hydrolase activator NlpD
VYSIGPGWVSYAQRDVKGAWGNIVVIEHEVVDGVPLFSRYGHVEGLLVDVGDRVEAGTPIAHVGNGDGRFPYHLHFDISLTTILRSAPWHWPGWDRAAVVRHYVDPLLWLRANVIF